MTSNIGAREIKKSLSYGFNALKTLDEYEKMKDKISDELKRLFNPEFLNRVDDYVFFRHLELKDMTMIVDIVLKDIEKKLIDKNIELVLTNGAKKFIAEKGFDQVNGARPLKRTIQKYIEDPIAEEILKGRFVEGSIIQIKMKNKNELSFQDLSKKINTPI